jgi:hypothetical protein
VAREGVRAGARAQIDEADGRVLGGAGDEQVRGDGREGVRVEDGGEVEGGGGGEGCGGVDLEGVVVGGGEEGLGVEGVEGEVRYAEFVR